MNKSSVKELSNLTATEDVLANIHWWMQSRFNVIHSSNKKSASSKRDYEQESEQPSIAEEEEFIESKSKAADSSNLANKSSQHKLKHSVIQIPPNLLLQQSLSPNKNRTWNNATMSTMSNSDIKNLIVRTLDFKPFVSPSKQSSLSPSTTKKNKKFTSPTQDLQW